MSNESEQESFARGANGYSLSGNETDAERVAYNAGQTHQQNLVNNGSSSNTTDDDFFGNTKASANVSTSRPGLFRDNLHKLMRMYGGCTSVMGYLGVLFIFIEAFLIFISLALFLAPTFGGGSWVISVLLAAAFLIGFQYHISQLLTAIIGAAAFPYGLFYYFSHTPEYESFNQLLKIPKVVVVLIIINIGVFILLLLAFRGAIRDIEKKKAKK